MNLTSKQNEIVRFIWTYRRTHGIAPTLSEIAEALGVSKITVHEHIGLLEKKGALKKEKYQSRSLTLSRGVIKELEAVDRERERLGLTPAPHGSSSATSVSSGSSSSSSPSTTSTSASTSGRSSRARPSRRSRTRPSSTSPRRSASNGRATPSVSAGTP